MTRAVMQPVSGTYELRWQWYRGGAQERDGDPEGAPTPAEAPELALMGAERRLDEVTPTP